MPGAPETVKACMEKLIKCCWDCPAFTDVDELTLPFNQCLNWVRLRDTGRQTKGVPYGKCTPEVEAKCLRVKHIALFILKYGLHYSRSSFHELATSVSESTGDRGAPQFK